MGIHTNSVKNPTAENTPEKVSGKVINNVWITCRKNRFLLQKTFTNAQK